MVSHNNVFLGNQETPITTNVVEASDGVIQRKIKSGDRGNVQVNIPKLSIGWQHVARPLNCQPIIFFQSRSEPVTTGLVSIKKNFR